MTSSTSTDFDATSRCTRTNADACAPTPSAAGLQAPVVCVGFASASERRSVHEWLAKGMRPERPSTLRQEYPLLLTSNASVVPVYLTLGGKPQAICVLWAVTFRVGLSSLRVGLISLVYTEPGARGRGYARRVVDAAVAEARGLELGVVFLWSDLDALYQGLGFVKTGAESLLVVDGDLIEEALEDLSEEMTDGSARLDPEPRLARAEDWPHIERARGDRMAQIQLDAGEISRMSSIPGMRTVVARDHEGRFGFAICGRGEDFQEVIHEWGGEPELVLRCCRALALGREPDRELFLLSPPARSPVTWALRCAGAGVIRKPMAWARVASPQALAEDVSRLHPELPGLQLCPIETEPGGTARLRVKSRDGEVELSVGVLLDGLFGAQRSGAQADAIRALERITGPESAGRWPLPFFIWGLESI